MFILSRKQLLFIAILSLAGEFIITAGLLWVEYMGWLNNTGQNIILWVFFPLVALVTGCLSRLWTSSWFVALLVPLMVFVSFILVSMNSLYYLFYVPLYLAVSLGGYYLVGVSTLKGKNGR